MPSAPRFEDFRLLQRVPTIAMIFPLDRTESMHARSDSIQKKWDRRITTMETITCWMFDSTCSICSQLIVWRISRERGMAVCHMQRRGKCLESDDRFVAAYVEASFGPISAQVRGIYVWSGLRPPSSLRL